MTYNLAKINGQRSCGIGDITYLICRVTLQEDLVIKGFCDCSKESSLLYRTTLPDLVAIVIGLVEISHVTL